MKNNKDLEVLIQNLHKPRFNSSKNHLISDCPYCGKRGHFFVNITEKKFGLHDCKKCGENGSKQKLFSAIGIEIEKKLDALVLQPIGFQKDSESDLDHRAKLVSLPFGYKRVQKNVYLNQRMPYFDYGRYEVGKTDLVFNLENYILFPIRESGISKGFVGRYANKLVPEDCLRYKNSVQTDFAKLFYGFDDIGLETKTVIIVEGIFDKIAVDFKLGLKQKGNIVCLCSFGKKISKYQILKLREKGIDSIILLWDNDAIIDSKKYCSILKRNFFVAIGLLPQNKDPDESTEKELLFVFNNLMTPTEFFAGVAESKLKLERKL